MAEAAIELNGRYSARGDKRRRDQDRSRSRERGYDRNVDRDREADRYRDRDRDSSRRVRSRSKSPDRASRRHRSRDRSRERSRDRGRDRSRERGRDRSRDRSRERGGRYGSEDRHDRDRDRDSKHRSRRDEHGRVRDDDRHRRSDDRERSERSRDKDKESENRRSEQRSEEREEEEDGELDADIEIKIGEEENEVDKVLEESRRRRQAILEKFKAQKADAKQADTPAAASSKDGASPSKGDQRFGLANGALSTALHSSSTPADADADAVAATGNGTVPTAAASLGQTDARAHAHAHASKTANDALFPVFSGDVAKPLSSSAAASPPKGDGGTDMFADDMFGESPAAGRKLGKFDGAAKEFGLNDNWDDVEGYYLSRVGEVLDGRYEIAATQGRGVFSTVLKAWDLKEARREVAIKIIRNNETMFKAGQQELVILRKIAGADPDDRRHCIRLISSFQYRGHLCLVFESMHMNLREVLKKFGRNIGINLSAVRAYATQLFLALKHLRNCGILHCDIKPDNMLVNESKNVLKLADFGSAMFSGDNEITPYLVSRFYRAPEIMLGLPYDHPLDMWSVGCCLYELYTGKMLFPGRTNNDMIRLHIELKGTFPKKLLKKAAFLEQHFDADFNFCAIEEDPVTKKPMRRVMANVKPKDIGTLLAGSSDDDARSLAAFRDLLDKIFCLDPDKRLTVAQALSHPFIVGR
ncbi:unnamed protein product [Closterium sp. Yama58-4]|nr:unnamed protein product [Closterium sp. Yama58-4]